MLDHLYAQIVGARRRWYERRPQARRRLAQPVLSVGNLSVGGTGKTPLVAMLAEWLLARGERPSILSRGYGRRDRADGAVVVSDGSRVLETVHRAGDEPLMLSRAVPGAVVVVAEDRHVAGVVAERRLGATVHLLDDGFQHVQLARDLDVLVTTAGEIGGGRVLPFGRLREAASAAARADFLVVIDADDERARSEAWELGVSQYVAARRVIAEARDDRSVLAVAGIGQPDRFFSMLRDAGYRMAFTMPFPDHHRYTSADVARLEETARAAGADMVVTTAKDAVRFEALGPLPFTLVTVPMRLVVEPWERLGAAVDAALERARTRA